MDTYRVSTWDHRADGWSVEASGLTLWGGVRAQLRRLKALGWVVGFTLLVEREPAGITPPGPPIGT